MSLLVSLIAKEASFSTTLLETEITYPHNDLFGFESTRQSLWGHQLILDLNCPIMHSLSYTNIYSFDEEVLELETELKIISANVTSLAEATGYYAEFIAFRVANALETIRVAKNHLANVGVAID